MHDQQQAAPWVFTHTAGGNRLLSGAFTRRSTGMTTIIIELDFESDDVRESDVINYLNELIEQDCLGWEVRK